MDSSEVMDCSDMISTAWTWPPGRQCPNCWKYVPGSLEPDDNIEDLCRDLCIDKGREEELFLSGPLLQCSKCKMEVCDAVECQTRYEPHHQELCATRQADFLKWAGIWEPAAHSTQLEARFQQAIERVDTPDRGSLFNQPHHRPGYLQRLAREQVFDFLIDMHRLVVDAEVRRCGGGSSAAAADGRFEADDDQGSFQTIRQFLWLAANREDVLPDWWNLGEWMDYKVLGQSHGMDELEHLMCKMEFGEPCADPARVVRMRLIAERITGRSWDW